MNLPFFHSDNLMGLNSPELPDGQIWHNLPAGRQVPKIKELNKNKKVVMIDFWTYSCVNCLRTLPYVKHWHEKYVKDGLVIIGVHTPEFGFEKDPTNLERFLKEQKIKYPVVMDNDYKIWNSFANNCWPRKFLINTSGKIILDHSGEGGYSETEIQIQKALLEINPTLNFDRVVPEEEHLGEGAVCFPMTPELYCGYQRGILGNSEGFFPDRVFDYNYIDNMSAMIDGKFYLQGSWKVADQFASHAVTNKVYEEHIGIAFHGLEANAVMSNTSNKTEEVLVLLDGKSIPKELRGEDVTEKDGLTVVKVHEPRMYRIYKAGEFGNHVLKLSPLTRFFQIYAFTFGGCSH